MGAIVETLTRSIRTTTTTALGVLVVALLSMAPVAAQDVLPEDEPVLDDEFGDDEGYLDWLEPGATPELDSPREVEQGECSPATFAMDQVTTCRFPVVGATELSNWGVLRAHVVDENSAGFSDRCLLEDDMLVCEDMPGAFVTGQFRVAIDGLTGEESRASITIDRTADGVLGLSVGGTFPLPVFAEAATSIEVFRAWSQATDSQLDLLLRREGDDEVVERMPALAPGEEFEPVELLIPSPGRWTLTGCQRAVGDTDGTQACVKEGIARPLEAIAPTPFPLVDGLNDRSAERINMVFVGDGFGSETEATVREEAIRLLSLDGSPTQIGRDGDVWDLGWGPFAIEPFRSNIGRFNFWYLEGEVGLGTTPFDPPFGSNLLDPQALGLGSDVLLVLIDRTPGRATGSFPSFVDDVELDADAPRQLGSVHLPVPVGSEYDHAVLAHELGHALFGLRDEYVEVEYEGVIAVHGPPNCVRSREEAEEAWGSLAGELDPMFHRWTEALDAFDLNNEWVGASADRFTVGYVPGGCYGPEDAAGVIRPTVDSLMNSNVPVLGSVNRARAEAVLALWPDPPPPAPPTTTTTTTTTTTVVPETTTTTSTATAVVTSAPGDQVAGAATGPSPASPAGSSTGSLVMASLLAAGVLFGAAGMWGVRRLRSRA